MEAGLVPLNHNSGRIFFSNQPFLKHLKQKTFLKSQKMSPCGRHLVVKWPFSWSLAAWCLVWFGCPNGPQPLLVGGFNPSDNMLVKMASSSPGFRGKNKKTVSNHHLACGQLQELKFLAVGQRFLLPQHENAFSGRRINPNADAVAMPHRKNKWGRRRETPWRGDTSGSPVREDKTVGDSTEMVRYVFFQIFRVTF